MRQDKKHVGWKDKVILGSIHVIPESIIALIKGGLIEDDERKDLSASLLSISSRSERTNAAFQDDEDEEQWENSFSIPSLPTQKFPTPKEIADWLFDQYIQTKEIPYVYPLSNGILTIFFREEGCAETEFRFSDYLFSCLSFQSDDEMKYLIDSLKSLFAIKYAISNASVDQLKTTPLLVREVAKTYDLGLSSSKDASFLKPVESEREVDGAGASGCKKMGSSFNFFSQPKVTSKDDFRWSVHPHEPF